MSLAAIWDDLEKGRADGAGQLVRRIHPESSVDLYLAVEKPGNRRMLILAVAEAAASELGELPSGRGIEARLQAGGERVQLQLRLLDPGSTDIFGALVADVAAAVAPSAEDAAAVGAWAARLGRWQRLLAHLSPDGLSAERQRGLYAELWLMREHLLPGLAPEPVLEAWTGPSAASHDFEFPRGAVEVKSTAGKQHQRLRIASERQLDDTGVSQLFLFHLSLDVRLGEGETLPAAVADLRARLEDRPALVLLEERLLASGYAHAHEPRYLRTAYTMREQNLFRVGEDFPRLTEADLPAGVGDVRYSVAVAECKHFAVPTDILPMAIAGDGP